MLFLKRLIACLREYQHKRQYVYGHIFRPEDGYTRENVRLNKHTKRIEFVLWKAGEQGHTEDYPMGYKWEDYFTPYQLIDAVEAIK